VHSSKSLTTQSIACPSIARFVLLLPSRTTSRFIVHHLIIHLVLLLVTKFQARRRSGPAQNHFRFFVCPEWSGKVLVHFERAKVISVSVFRTSNAFERTNEQEHKSQNKKRCIQIPEYFVIYFYHDLILFIVINC
jgi:hypothetical protein